jgi:thymidine phosphorylase
VEKGEPLMTLHVNDRRQLGEAEALVREAVRIEDQRRQPPPLIHMVLD